MHDAIDRMAVPGPEPKLLRREGGSASVSRPTEAGLGGRDVEDLVDASSADLGCLPADHLFGARIDAHDAQVPVGDDETIREGADQSLDAPLLEVEPVREVRTVEGDRDLGRDALDDVDLLRGEVVWAPRVVEPQKSEEPAARREGYDEGRPEGEPLL